MNSKIVSANRKFLWLLLAAALVLLAAVLPARNRPESQPAIYDPGADIKTQISAAVNRAGSEGRNILLIFGFDRCPWCRSLHELFAADAGIRKVLDERYIVLWIDVSKKSGGQPLNRDLVDHYRVQGFGYPALAVLDQGGKLLCAQSTGVLEKGKGHDAAKVLAFLTLQIGE